MALFSRKKDTETQAQAPAQSSTSTRRENLAHILKHARITEKATMKAAMNAYIFDVAENSTKSDVAKAVRKLYSVTPRMVRMIKVPSKAKKNMRTGKSGVKKGGKKAYVYLKKGETINIS